MRSWAAPEKRTGGVPAPSAAAWLVGGFWLVLTVADLAYVAWYGPNCPYWDEWDQIPHLARLTPYWSSLWVQNNEHRLPLARFVFNNLIWLAGNDFRAGMYFTVLALSASALFLLALARRLRGRVDYLDAFLPLVLLNWGHHENFLVTFQVCFSLSAVLAVGLLGVIVTAGPLLTAGRGWLAGALLLLLAMCSANGLVFVPPLALWLWYGAWQRGRSDGLGAAGLLTLAPVPALVYTVLYFQGLQRAGHHPPPESVGAAVRVAFEFLVMGCGFLGKQFWPIVHRQDWPFSALLVGFLGVAASTRLARVWWLRPAERLRSLGLLVFLGAHLGLGLAIGWGRAGLDPMAGFISRYVSLAAPALCGLHFTGLLYGRPWAYRSVSLPLVVLASLFFYYQVADLDVVAQGMLGIAGVLFELYFLSGLWPAADRVVSRLPCRTLALILVGWTAYVVSLTWEKFPVRQWVLQGYWDKLPVLFWLVLLLYALYFLGLVQVRAAGVLPAGVGRSTFLFLVALTLLANVRDALDFGLRRKQAAADLARDVAAGVPPAFLVDRHSEFLYPNKKEMPRYLRLLRDHGFGFFGALRDDPPAEEIEYPLAQGGRGYKLDPPRRLLGVRLELHWEYPPPLAFPLYLDWKSPGRDEVRSTYVYVHHHAKDQTLSFWIDDTVESFGIGHSEWGVTPGVSRVTLIVPAPR